MPWRSLALEEKEEVLPLGKWATDIHSRCVHAVSRGEQGWDTCDADDYCFHLAVLRWLETSSELWMSSMGALRALLNTQHTWMDLNGLYLFTWRHLMYNGLQQWPIITECNCHWGGEQWGVQFKIVSPFRCKWPHWLQNLKALIEKRKLSRFFLLSSSFYYHLTYAAALN